MALFSPTLTSPSAQASLSASNPWLVVWWVVTIALEKLGSQTAGTIDRVKTERPAGK